MICSDKRLVRLCISGRLQSLLEVDLSPKASYLDSHVASNNILRGPRFSLSFFISYAEDLHKALKALRPSKAVMRHIRVVEQKLKNMQFRSLHRAAPSWSHRNKSKQTGVTYIGVHVRTNQPDAEPGFALPDSAYTPEGWVTLKQMRSRTRVEVFIAEIERLFESVGDPSVCEVLSVT